MRNNRLRAWSWLLILVLALGVTPVAMAAKSPLEFEQTWYKTVVGVATTVALKQPVGSDLPEDITFSIKKAQQKTAKVDASTGVVTPLKKGTVYVYASSKSLGSKATVKVKVKIVANEIAWKTANNKSYSFWASPKRIYYSGGKLVAEWYVYNNYAKYGMTAIKPATGFGALGWYFLDTTGAGGGTAIGACTFGTYKFSKIVGKGKYGVVKQQLKTDSTVVPDLTSGKYALSWIAWPNGVLFEYRVPRKALPVASKSIAIPN